MLNHTYWVLNIDINVKGLAYHNIGPKVVFDYI